MSRIMLRSNYESTNTSIPNIFIDHHMSSANGEFVKVFLYLLRHMDSPEDNFSISKIADHFNHTENDITRALKYWESVNLLRLEYDESEHLTGICFLDYDTPAARTASPAPAASGSAFLSNAAGNHSPAPEKPSYTLDEIAGFRQNNEICELLYIAETYLGRTLNPTDCQTIFYLFDKLQFSTDLIEYLIEYCVVKGHTSIRYIEKTGLGWHEQGIRSVNEAKESTTLHTKSHTAVMKAFGINGRSLIKPEQDFIRKWTGSYGFSEEIISEACKRTITSIHQPSFEYADKILQSWKRSQVKQPSDIARLDAIHRQQAAPSSKTAPASNKFNNFTQRSYDYEQLEKQLLQTARH